MKRLSLRLTIAVVTFFIGVGIAAFWLVNHSVPIAVTFQKTPDCIPQYNVNISPNDYGDTNKASLFARFRELPLDKQPACVDESYRLTWIPTFHAPTVIRVWRSGEKYFIVTKRLDGKGGYGMGNFNGEMVRSLTAEEWLSFVNLINQESFWSMPSEIMEPLPNDGAAWTFEGTNGGEYHFIFRIMPSDKLRNIFRSLFKLTSVETEHELYLS